MRLPPLEGRAAPPATASSRRSERSLTESTPAGARSKALEHRAFGRGFFSEFDTSRGPLEAFARMEDISTSHAKSLRASGTRISLRHALRRESNCERDCTTSYATSAATVAASPALVASWPSTTEPPCQGPDLGELIRPGDVLKISRPRNIADHVMLAIQRPRPVAVIEVAAADGDSAVADDVCFIDIFAVCCLESSNNLEFFERRTYWIVAHPGDCCMALIDPDEPAKTSEWERISVLNSPFGSDDLGASADHDVEVHYPEGGPASLDTDVVLAAGELGAHRHVKEVLPGGPAELAGVRRGDLLLRVHGASPGHVLATFRLDQRRTCLDGKAFNLAVWEVEQQKLHWSLRTATRAVIRRARIAAAEYAGDDGLRRLAAELRELWEQDPICTTVPIRVWQRYLFRVWKGDDCMSASEVLRVIPLKGDRTLPSELWACLLDTGFWKELHLSEALWRASQGLLPGAGDSDEAKARLLRRRLQAAPPRADLTVFHAPPEILKRRRPHGCHCETM